MLTSINIPNSVTSIGEGAFGYCSVLTSVIIGNSVTSIGMDAFRGCFGLTSVAIGNSVTSIGDFAFESCTGLTSVTIPNSVTSIGEYAFHVCMGLTHVIIGKSVTKIGYGAFDHGDKITTIISLIENPYSIDGSTFSHDTFNNAMLYVPTGTIDKYKATEGWKDFENIVEGVPSGIKGVHLDSDKDYPVYDINGRRLEGPQRGINIINGKKVVVK